MDDAQLTRVLSTGSSGDRRMSGRIGCLLMITASALCAATCGSQVPQADEDSMDPLSADGGRPSMTGGDPGRMMGGAAGTGFGGDAAGGTGGLSGGTSGGTAGVGMGGRGAETCPAPTPLAPAAANAVAGTQYEVDGAVMWLPNGVQTIRGLVGFASFASGASGYDDTKMRAMAARNSLGLVRWNPGCWWCARQSYDDLKTGADRLMGTVLPSLATKSGHPEVAFTGIFATGLSAGSWDASALAIYYPKRVIGAFPVAGGWDGWVWQRMSGDTMKVPFVGINQGEDGFYPGSSVGTEEDITRGRGQSAPWSHMIALGCGHDSWCKMDWIYIWIEEVTRHRVPANIPTGMPPTYTDLTEACGWLGKLVATNRATSGSRWEVSSADVWSAAMAPGDPKTLQWFPSQRAAESWKRYMTNKGMLP